MDGLFYIYQPLIPSPFQLAHLQIYTEFRLNHIKQLTLSSNSISVLPIFFRQTCLSTVTSITSSCIDNTCPYKSVFRCFSSYKVSNRNNNARTRRDSVVLNKRDNVRTFMFKLELVYVYCQAQVQSPSPNPSQGTWGDSIITWATHPTPPITFNHEGVL